MKTFIKIAIAAILFNVPLSSKASVIDQLTDALNTGSSITYGYGGHTHTWWCWWYGCNYDDGGGNDVPLDGGLSFLAIAGAGLGIKKYTDSRKKNKKEDK